MTGRGYNPLVGFDDGNPPPGSHNHNRALPQNFQISTIAWTGNVGPVIPVPILSVDNNHELNKEPDIEYVNPPKFCILHVLLSSTKPDLSPTRPQPVFKKLGVPTSTTMWELIEIINSRIDETNINTIYELIEKGGGRWSTGMIFRKDNVDRMSKTLEYFGWDESRDGQKNPEIWLAACSEKS
ncbi:hypothetical protein GcM3_030008 [Golovinomyces cichoracearum]|uniref:Uncharacterized protein n=1 Tax=Golovinomyces cichoracearum TaxID=62708 RepID=A0A420J558_9PEZI|nr:hypothetical protein GcM3_030008 [Golovinomyces cichoracearum]